MDRKPVVEIPFHVDIPLRHIDEAFEKPTADGAKGHSTSDVLGMIEPTTGDGKGRGWPQRFAGSPGGDRWLTPAALGLLVGVTALVVGWVLVNGQAGLHREGGHITNVQDFASHTRFTRAAWTGEFRSPPSLYTVGAHLRFMGKWAGEPVGRALPFGYAPSMLWVLGPFSALPLPIAYVLWSLAGVGAAVWIVLRRRVHRLLAVMVLLSPVAVASVALGQTAILSAAGLFFLMDRSLAEPGDPLPPTSLGGWPARRFSGLLGPSPPSLSPRAWRCWLCGIPAPFSRRLRSRC